MLDTSSQSVIKDNIPSVVEEPPLKDRKSCLRRGCSFLFGVFFLAALAVIAIGLFFQPRPTRLASLPANFPSVVPLFKFEDRAAINYYPGAKKDRLWERLALNVFKKDKWPALPKILLAPPAGRDIDTTEIVWQNLNNSLREIENFYSRRLTSEDFALGVVKREAGQLILIFNKKSITGTLQIDQPKGAGSSVILRVDYKK